MRAYPDIGCPTHVLCPYFRFGANRFFRPNEFVEYYLHTSQVFAQARCYQSYNQKQNVEGNIFNVRSVYNFISKRDPWKLTTQYHIQCLYILTQERRVRCMGTNHVFLEIMLAFLLKNQVSLDTLMRNQIQKASQLLPLTTLDSPTRSMLGC